MVILAIKQNMYVLCRLLMRQKIQMVYQCLPNCLMENVQVAHNFKCTKESTIILVQQMTKERIVVVLLAVIKKRRFRDHG